MTNVSSQVAAAHLELIEAVGAALASSESTATADTAALLAIDRYREDGWNDLAEALTRLLAGQTVDESTLDDEDRMILAAIERVADDPLWLQQVVEQAEVEAAEQIAALILAGTWGERDALAALNEMREAARAAGLMPSWKATRTPRPDWLDAHWRRSLDGSRTRTDASNAAALRFIRPPLRLAPGAPQRPRPFVQRSPSRESLPRLATVR